MLENCNRRFFATKFLDNKDRIFQNLYGDLPSDLKSAQSRGDWLKIDEILKKGPNWIVNEVKKSEIRGRGGAGFTTGQKWEFIKKDEVNAKYLVVNADEGEPGTCKDRQILTNEPHKLIEGALLTASVFGAHTCYVYVRGEFGYEINQLQKAIDEAYAAGLVGEKNQFNYPFDIMIHPGAGAYICGEETALLNSLEGKPGRPRFKPPFPAQKGLYGCPTIINNVETISSIGTICKRGGEWFSKIGIPGSRGTKIFCISGSVNNPCVVEEALGVPLKDLIEKYAGGVIGGWDNLLGIIPGGSSCQILSKEQCDNAVMGFDELKSLGSALGTGGIIVMNKDVDIFKAFQSLSQFYMHESCGQCPPCRNSTKIISELVDKFAEGTATKDDLKKLEDIANKKKKTICALCSAASDPIKGLFKHFRKELEDRCKQ